MTGTIATPTALSPATTGVGATPQISFTPPVPAPASYTFSVGVFDASFNLMWEVNGNQSSAGVNFTP